jgi:acetyl/propionyl-CoA carboxylase alpha subunit
MGDKAAAKRRMLAAGVPCAPGYLGEDQSDGRLVAEAQALGLPLLVKAVAGGGGRGMRLVRDFAELPQALAGARREAGSAFGDGTLMLERLIEGGRHIEVQVFADAHGRAIHLGERDCTAQRRRQKVVEEAPSPLVDPAMREAMGRDAVAAALAVGYRRRRHGRVHRRRRRPPPLPRDEHAAAGRAPGHRVRHRAGPGRVAAAHRRGEPLPLQQHEVRLQGHAIELRLYAEDPYDGWSPQTGRILGWAPERAGVRVDHGIASGGEVPPWYDGMVAKFIAHGRDRDDAIRRLCRALGQSPLFGPINNARFLRDLLQHPAFREARMSTSLLDEWAAAGAPLLQRPVPPDEAWTLAAALLAGAPGGRPASVAKWQLTLACQGRTRTLAAPPEGIELLSWQGDEVRWQARGLQRRAFAVRDGAGLQLALDAAVYRFAEASPWPAHEPLADPLRALAPVAGVVARVAVAVGDCVEAGQPLVCVEAMKMEMWQLAGCAGRVKAVAVRVRASRRWPPVRLLVELEPLEQSPWTPPS